MHIVGIDLAWGEKKSDGVFHISTSGRSARVVGMSYPQGDTELIEALRPVLHPGRTALLTIDAPIVCPNRTGTRPVDRLTHRMFHREHAACHPANSTKCPRPPRLRRKLETLGAITGWEIRPGSITAAEVYPHPAMVRLFRLERIIKYKKGRVAERRTEFGRLQREMRDLLARDFPWLTTGTEADHLLRSPWSKTIEDLTDAFFCALIGLWHWRYRGKRSEVIGNATSGFILLPEDRRRENQK